MSTYHRLSILCLALTLLASIAYAESPNYCYDKEPWEQWDAFVAKHHADDGVQNLNALRLGLCVKIEAGSITLDRVVTIFEPRLMPNWWKNGRKRRGGGRREVSRTRAWIDHSHDI